jgi:hypothetical protein
VIQPGYNGQIAVDDKDGVIVAANVSQNATDHADFKPMMEQVERNFGALPDRGTADAGYSSYDNLEYAEGKKVCTCQTTFWERWMRKRRATSGITRVISTMMRQEIPIFARR